MLMRIPQCFIVKFQMHSVNDNIYDFDWVCIETPVRDCVIGMLLTYAIGMRYSVFI